jgi:hypothetical protein
MSQLVDDALEIFRHLPEDMQKAAARAIIDCAIQYDCES